MNESFESKKIVPTTRKGLGRLMDASLNSVAGIRTVLKTEEAFRLEALAFLFMAPIGLWLGNGPVEKLLLLGSLILVLLMELVNTAIETVVDRFGDDYHELSKVAKDIGSAIVLIAIVFVLVVWGMLLV
jgi:diacylglycerol kinase (ATP)